MKNKFVKTLLRFIPLIVISLAVGLRLYMWNAKSLVRNAMPMPFGCGISVVLSSSMEPELSVNDLVFVKQQQNYSVGEIIVYQEGSMLIIHRVIAVDGDEITTQGDANDIADLPIDVSDVKGKAVWHIPALGAAVRFLQSPVGFVILLIAAAASFELPYRRQRQSAIDEQERIKEEIRRLKGE